MKQYDSGLLGEEQAEACLRGKGYVCLERRYRGGDGEIDLICRDGETLVFVEVKSRPFGMAGEGLMAVTRQKQCRMTHAARRYLAKRDAWNVPVRFDVVEITAQGVLHVQDAFRPEADW